MFGSALRPAIGPKEAPPKGAAAKPVKQATISCCVGVPTPSRGGIPFWATCAAAAMYIAMGHNAALTAISIRVLIVAIYLLSALALPLASHLIVTSDTLDGGTGAYPLAATSATMGFLAVYAGLSVLVLLLLHQQLTRLRAQHEDASATP